ncbi:hypothetical protein OESDEN_23796 [Oesophagostomum dentatum]|uniref:Uncharacterized protein n=1 Tax=Oesophagostomum dentatum TaxID=61180 RepID=A0A0B1RV86_OESDE|nr:hypothetical protein OESDEN_23796 [Oesophagostomum dentatum]
MDSLPDPPYLSVQKLPELERAFRSSEGSSRNPPSTASSYSTMPPKLTSDDLPSPEYLNLRPVPRSRPSKNYPRIESLFSSEPPAISVTSNLETTSFIEQLDVTTLLTTATTFPRQPASRQAHDVCSGTHRILIDEECEFSSCANAAEASHHAVTKSRGTPRSLDYGSSEEIAL